MSTTRLTAKLYGFRAAGAISGYFLNPIRSGRWLLERHGNSIAMTVPFAKKSAPPLAFLLVGAENNRAVYKQWDDLRMNALWSVKAHKDSAQRMLRFNHMCLSGDAHGAVADQVEAPLRRGLVELLIGPLQARIGPLLDAMPRAKDFDLEVFSKELSMQCVFASLLGENDPQEAVRIGSELEAFTHSNYRILNKVLPLRIPGGPYDRLIRQSHLVQDSMSDWMDAAGTEGKEMDLRAAVRDLTDADGEPLERQFRVASLSAMAWASYHTPGLGILWTLVLLSRNPGIARALRDEVRMAGDPATYLLDTLINLPVLNGVVLESLRLIPPAPYIPLRVIRDTAFGAIEAPRGSTVLLSARETHRDPRHYPEPDRFLPSRWNTKSPDAYQFIAFSGGARRCPGASFSIILIKLVVAMIAGRGAIDVLAKGDIPVTVAPTASPRGPVWARFQTVD